MGVEDDENEEDTNSTDEDENSMSLLRNSVLFKSRVGSFGR